MFIKCVASDLKLFFTAGNIYKGKKDKESGNFSIKIDGKWHPMAVINGTLFINGSAGGEPARAQFVEMKTKTIKCTKVMHHLDGKKSFKEGKRYQIDMGRPCGSVAGYVFDEDGSPWTLYREDVGYSCATALFEAKYS